MQKSFSLFLFVWLTMSMASCAKTPGGDKTPFIPVDTNSRNLPVLAGKLVYHTYSCYSCNDSRMYLFDFATKKLTCLSASWNITNPMNAHISPDGRSIVFMGMPAGTSNWDIFKYTLGASGLPVDLTINSAGRNEDPKFSPDGSRIIFKRNGILKEMDTTGLVLRTIVVPQQEASMPYYTADTGGLLYAANETGGGTTLDIFLISPVDGTSHALSSLPDVEEYYPIVRDDTSFFFTRWNTKDNRNDQVYLGFYDSRPFQRLPFNQANDNFSDAFPVDGHTVVLSSTKPGGKGGYDLFLADMITGKTWSLNLFYSGINTADNELGACYSNH